MNRYLFLFLIFSFSFSFSQQDYKRLGAPYYPELFLSEKDSLKWPIIFDISIDVKDIKNLDVNSNEIYSKVIVNSFSEYDTVFVPEKSPKQSLKHWDFFAMQTKMNSLMPTRPGKLNYYNADEYSYLFYDNFYSKGVWLVEAPFDINWNLRNFPFDTQEIKFKFTSVVDSSIIKLKPSKGFPTTYSNNMESLEDGFTINSISYNYTYNEDQSDLITISPNKPPRPTITETLEIILNLNRDGSWLFIKLFLGGILSYFISCMMFLLPINEKSEEKYTLAMSAIFGAIGNRYFVDSLLPNVQVFTKADAINNILIIMIIVNILIMILQASNKTFLSKLQTTRNALFYSISILIGLILLVLIS
tara:strand:- start:443 stop:1522 length:1080 start_codon:yes stop_codon:yes gene_type:complete